MNQAELPIRETEREKDIRENKDIAAASYLWVMSVIVYLGRKDSPFVRYHARQGIVLFLMSLPLWFIPVAGNLLEFFVLAGMVMGFINAFQGHYADVPLVGPLAKGEMTVTQAYSTAGKYVRKLLNAILGGRKPPDPHETKSSLPPSPPAP